MQREDLTTLMQHPSLVWRSGLLLHYIDMNPTMSQQRGAASLSMYTRVRLHRILDANGIRSHVWLLLGCECQQYYHTNTNNHLPILQHVPIFLPKDLFLPFLYCLIDHQARPGSDAVTGIPHMHAGQYFFDVLVHLDRLCV
jgi:hypothetical protein